MSLMTYFKGKKASCSLAICKQEKYIFTLHYTYQENIYGADDFGCLCSGLLGSWGHNEKLVKWMKVEKGGRCVTKYISLYLLAFQSGEYFSY